MFDIRDDHLIPVEAGQAVGRGWLAATDYKPMGVTWHWTVTRDLALCRRILGGANPTRKGVASAHYGVGRTYAEGVDRYVALENRAWHAGMNQTLRWDGAPSTNNTKGARATIGVETVNIGYAREGFPAGPDWIEAAGVTTRRVMGIQPWTDEQFVMMIAVGKEIVARWPHIGPDDHHGHHDVCPGYKDDVTGFDFARLLRGIYDDLAIPDVWTPLMTPRQRQKALIALGYDLGRAGADGDWGRMSQGGLEAFQSDHSRVLNGYWTSFTSRDVHRVMGARGIDLAAATA